MCAFLCDRLEGAQKSTQYDLDLSDVEQLDALDSIVLRQWLLSLPSAAQNSCPKEVWLHLPGQLELTSVSRHDLP